MPSIWAGSAKNNAVSVIDNKLHLFGIFDFFWYYLRVLLVNLSTVDQFCQLRRVQRIYCPVFF